MRVTVVARVAILALLGLAALFALVTIVALEGQEVVVVRTGDARGHVRETRTWIADHEGSLLIEAANPEREFYHHILANPEVELRRDGEWQRCHAVPIATREGHALIRALLSRKYGWADRWVGLIADTSRSIAIRLACLHAWCRGIDADPFSCLAVGERINFPALPIALTDHW